MGYDHKLRTAGTPLGQKSSNRRELVQNSGNISNTDLKQVLFLVLFLKFFPNVAPFKGRF